MRGELRADYHAETIDAILAAMVHPQTNGLTATVVVRAETKDALQMWRGTFPLTVESAERVAVLIRNHVTEKPP